MIPLELGKISIQTINAPWLNSKNINLDVLRLDTIHPIISGNKYFKLKYYIQDALEHGLDTIATFGGAWSNHISATAYACKLYGLQSIGIVRGEKPAVLSATLQQAQENGMTLYFISRELYRDKLQIQQLYKANNWYWVDEGGFGFMGEKGAREILQFVAGKENYSHIIAAVGTGTMLAALINTAALHQHVLGISSMKGNKELDEIVKALVRNSISSWSINHDYHFGGYGKFPPSLIHFMNDVFSKHQLPLDIIYTSKVMYAIKDLAEKNTFLAGSNVLMIHSGGLQGNQSLSPQVLAF